MGRIRERIFYKKNHIEARTISDVSRLTNQGATSKKLTMEETKIYKRGESDIEKSFSRGLSRLKSFRTPLFTKREKPEGWSEGHCDPGEVGLRYIMWIQHISPKSIMVPKRKPRKKGLSIHLEEKNPLKQPISDIWCNQKHSLPGMEKMLELPCVFF